MRAAQFAHKVLLSALFAISFSISSGAQSPPAKSQLGSVQFPTSGSPAAQPAFLRGLAAMHSFWYEEALEEFQAAAKLDPDFAMAYWGQAMTYNHPLWAQQDTPAGRQALAKIKDESKLTAKEKAFIAAARALYGEGDKLARDYAYAAAMEKIYRDYPADLEAAAFYSLSLLGTVRPTDKGFQRQMKAGAIATEVYLKNPNHPGAAHYIIHAFDDPEHAILALPAARRYAEIAPAAHHARHMPAHIFLQLGMWPEAASSNETAWAVSDEWVTRKKLPLNLRDYHSYHWLTYVYCQQGRYDQAAGLIERLRQTMKDHGRESVRWYDDIVAAYLVDAQRWELIDKLYEKVEVKAAADAGGEHAGHGSHGGAAAAASAKPATAATMVPSSRRGMSMPLFMRAFAAASQGKAAEAEKLLAEMRAIRQQNSDAYAGKMMEIRELEVSALLSASKKNFDEASAAMKKATALEEEMAPPSGPPTLIKPSHELFGEILLRAGKPAEAVKQFETALSRQPNRARSLIGLARAKANSGDKAGATTAYVNVLKIWQQADANLPEVREAREFVGQASSQRTTLDIYYVDVEGGAATLIVTPAGESILVDAGWPGFDGRDATRIQKAMKEAGISEIDHLVTTHYHTDHYGGTPEIARRVKVNNFYDHGPMSSLPDDRDFATRYAAYQEASKGKSITLKPGSEIKLKQVPGVKRLSLQCLAARTEVASGAEGQSNDSCPTAQLREEDKSDNARSVVLLLRYEAFDFLDSGDLTWNIEHKLVCPVNMIGEIDLFQVAHHGANSSNNTALLRSIKPTVAVMNNGPRKGGHPDVVKALREVTSIKDLYQVHRNVMSGDENNAPAEFIANLDEKNDEGLMIRVSVDAKKQAFTVTNDRTRQSRTYSIK